MSASLASACSLTSIISLESRRLRTGSLGTSAVECPTSLGSISLNSSNELLKNGIFLEATSSTRRVPLSIVGRAGGSRPTYKPRPKPSSKGRGANQEERNDGPLMNEAIRVPQVRLLGADQVMVGVVTRDEALAKAREASLDLVMIAPDAEPPVVRIMDYSKFRYLQQKKKREAQKKASASRQELKELKMRYNIDSHDYNVRLRAALRFLGAGDKVKVSLQFRGREMEFKDLAVKLFQKFQADLNEVGILEQRPSMEGRNMVMLMGPNKAYLAKVAAEAKKSKRRSRKEEGGAAASGDGDNEESGEDEEDDDDEITDSDLGLDDDEDDEDEEEDGGAKNGTPVKEGVKEGDNSNLVEGVKLV